VSDKEETGETDIKVSESDADVKSEKDIKEGKDDVGKKELEEEEEEKGEKEKPKAEEGAGGATSSSATPRKKKKGGAGPVEEVSLEDSPPLRRSSRKKTPTKYAELIENELDRYEDDDLMEVQEIKDDDDDSDIQEVEPEDPLGGEGSSSSVPSISITKATTPSSSLLASRKPNVVTIDDLKTLQRLATSAKKSVDDQKRETSFSIIDTQSILAGKMGSGVSITPARPRSAVITPAGLNISPAGLTLGSGVTIKPNTVITPKTTTQLGSVTITSSGGGGGMSASPSSAVTKYSTTAELSDPNLTDDTFVVEAPSFIVPYVYEKPPKETIKAFTESITKLQKEKEQKEKEEKEKAKKEKEAEQKKRREERQKKRDAGEKDVEEDTEEEAEVVEDDDEETDKEKKAEKENKEPEKKDTGAGGSSATTPATGSRDSYFNSTLGKFFSDLGMNLVQEFVQKDLLRQQQRRSQKDKSAAVIHAINSLQKNLDDSREQNELFHHQLKKCRFCSFRTESRIVLQNHLETPHMRNGVYRCNFCEYETKIPQEVLFHMDSVHGVKGKMERAPYFHQCPQCPFEDNGKGKLTRHKMGCDKRFKTEINQAPEREWDPPAKIRPTPVRPGYAAYMPAGGNTVSGLAMGRGGVASFGMGSAGTVIRPGQSLLPGNRTFINNPRLQGVNRAALAAAARGRPVGSYKGPADLRIPQPGLLQQQQQQQQAAAAAKLRGLNPQMMSGQQMLAILNQQGLTVSQVEKTLPVP